MKCGDTNKRKFIKKEIEIKFSVIIFLVISVIFGHVIQTVSADVRRIEYDRECTSINERSL